VEACCVQKGVGIECKLQNVVFIVKTFISYLHYTQSAQLSTTTFPRRVEPAHLLLQYDLTIRCSMFLLKNRFKKE
jgi:hypothetical protein